MKTTVFLATLLCWELVSAFPFPEGLPYYGAYEPVAVPEQRVISQPIQIPNLARSQNSELAYQQQQLAWEENLRRQNYENLLRKQEQQEQAALNQRIANQLLIPTQPERSYNNAIPLSTVRQPYINSIPLQRPITQQYYQNQQLRKPYQTIEAPQQFQVQNPQPQPVFEPVSSAQPTYQYNRQYPPVPQYNAQNVLYDPRIREVLSSTPLKKRYLVLHPNGTIEHIDKIEHIVERHPNYILVNAGDIPRVKDGVTPAPVKPVAPVSPAAPVAPVAATSPEVTVSPIPPVSPAAPTEPLDPGVLAKTTTGPVTPVVPPTPEVPADPPVSATPAPSGAIPPSILNGTVPGPKPTVPPPTGPTTTPETVTAQTALPPQPLPTTLAPPPVDATKSAPSVETTITPPVVNATPSYPPPSDLPVPTPVTHPTVLSPPDVTTENPPTPAPENATAIAAKSQSPEESAVSTNVTSVAIQSDATVNANATDTKSADLTIPDLPFSEIPTKPIVWFRSTDLNFFDKLTSGDETFDIVYFFNVPREPRVLRDTKTIIHANGTVVEEKVETIYDDEDAPPRVIKTTKVTHPDDAKPKT